VFYGSFYEAISALPAENQAHIYDAIFKFAFENIEVELDGVEYAVFSLIKPQLVANRTRYENGCKGGRPRKEETETKPKQNQTETEAKPNENENVNVISLLKILKNRDSIASVCEMCKNNPRFSEITDEVLESLVYAGSEIETLNFGDLTVCREDFERLITKPHGFDGNMLVETANAVMACKETIKDRRYYILGIIVNRFMR
jgi:hypothetical protein